MTRDKLTPAEAWALWLDLLNATADLCGFVEATGGDDPGFTPQFKRGFYDIKAVAFPVEGHAPAQMAKAFLTQLQALIDVARDDRRAAIALAVAGSVRALEALWHAEQARLTQVQLTRHGAGD